MNILILGANSDIASSIAIVYAKKEGASLVLASRNLKALERQANDLRVRYQVKVAVVEFNACNYSSHRKFYEKLEERPDIVVIAFGSLGVQRQAEADFNEFRKVFDVNFLGAVSILEIVADDFEQVQRGTIIGISSVAGERGRQSNYAYGSAKGAFTIFLSGLRHRLFRSNVNVLTVLPGFVNTKMTANLLLPKYLTATPEQVASDIFYAVKKGRKKIYTLWFWKIIMIIVKCLPEFIFLKTKM